METVLLFQSTLNKSWRDKLSGIYRFAREKKEWFVQVVSRFATTSEIHRALKEWQPLGCLVDRGMEKGTPPDRIFGVLPVVYLDQPPSRPSDVHPCLMHDSAASARLASAELLRLKLASYAYLGMTKPYFWDAERLAAFRQEVQAIGQTVVVLDRRNLRTTLKALPRPCGVLAANDQCALDVYHAASAAGLTIPGDVALVGIDNDEISCESVSPGLTSVEPDFVGAGYRLAQMLDNEITLGAKARTARKQPPLERYGPRRLVRRGSTNLLPLGDPRVQRAMEFIRRHACESRLKIDDILAEMDCSRRLATLRFRQTTGHSILDEIHEQRLAKICDLLANTNWPIATVIAQSGYVSESFAQKLFRSHTGLTMRAWRTHLTRDESINNKPFPA